MWGKRIGWLLLAAAAALLYVFQNGAATLALLAVILLLPLSSAALLLPRTKADASLSVPQGVPRGEAAEGSLQIACASFPVFLTGCVSEKNLMTGAQTRQDFHGFITKKRPLTLPLAPDTAHCGALRLRVEGCYAVCPLGLFRKKLSLSAEAQLFVEPRRVMRSVSLADAADFLQDSQRFSDRRPGYDPSETFRIRDYAPGDPLRQIHWKLTEKADRLLVRDFGLPLVEQLLVLVETALPPGGTAEDADAVLGGLASLCGALVLQELPFRLGWQLPDGSYEERRIEIEADVSAALHALLQTPLASGERSVAACYAAEHLRCEHAHVAVLAAAPPGELPQLLRGNRVTLLLPRRALGEVPPDSGVFVQPLGGTDALWEL